MRFYYTCVVNYLDFFLYNLLLQKFIIDLKLQPFNYGVVIIIIMWSIYVIIHILTAVVDVFVLKNIYQMLAQCWPPSVLDNRFHYKESHVCEKVQTRAKKPIRVTKLESVYQVYYSIIFWVLCDDPIETERWQ